MSPALPAERPQLETPISQQIVAHTLELMDIGVRVQQFQQHIQKLLHRKWHLEMRVDLLREQEGKR